MDKNNQHHYCAKIDPPTKRVYDQTSAVKQFLQKTETLSPDEKFSVVFELIKSARFTQPQLNSIKNFITSKGKEQKASEQQSNVDSRAHSTFGILPSLVPASKVSLIVRGDLIEESSVLAVDIEKIIDRQHVNAAGDFAMVTLKGQLVLWCYIKRDDVCRFNSKLTGLTKEKLDRGISEEMLRSILSKILRENVLVGAAMSGDLKSVGYKTEKDLPIGTKIEDIQSFFRDKYGDSVSLSLLGQHFTGEDFQQGTHSSIRDARMTAMCYKIMNRMKSEGVTQFSCPEFDKLRDQQKLDKKLNKNAEKKFFDKCTCKIKPDKRKKKQAWDSLHNKMDLDYFD